MRQSIGHLAFASWFAMSSAAAESTACSPAIDGELSMTQRKSTFAARLSRPATIHSAVHSKKIPHLRLLIYYLRCLTHAWAQRFPRRTSKQGATEELCGMQRRRVAGWHDRVRRPDEARGAHACRHGAARSGWRFACRGVRAVATARERVSRRLASPAGGG